jgi:hypothetical protein
MRNVTLSLDSVTAEWARVEAAKAGTSISRWIGAKLERLQSAEAPAPGHRGEPLASVPAPDFSGFAEQARTNFHTVRRQRNETTMTSLTITLDETTARWARVEAAKAGMSLSRWMGEQLAVERARPAAISVSHEQRQALQRFLDGPGYAGISADLPTRESLYDRPALRRHESPDLQPRPRKPGQAG